MAKLFKKKFIATMAGLVAVTCLAGFLTNFVNRGDEECDHKKTVAIPGVAATCLADGLTEGKKCKDCDEVIEKQKAIPATGDHLDADKDYVCDVCNGNAGPTANMVEVAVKSWDNPAGKWLRVYKPGAGESRYFCTMASGEGPMDDYIGDCSLYITSDGICISEGIPVIVEGMTIIETDAYIDFYCEKNVAFAVRDAQTDEVDRVFNFTDCSRFDLDSTDGFYFLTCPDGECSDANNDYLCDVCVANMGPTANMVEVAMDGCGNIAGRWVRVYRTSAEEDDNPLYVANFNCDDPDHNHGGDFEISVTDSGFKKYGTSCEISGIEFIETEDYVDFYFEIGKEITVYAPGQVVMSKLVILPCLYFDLNTNDGVYFLVEPDAV